MQRRDKRNIGGSRLAPQRINLCFGKVLQIPLYPFHSPRLEREREEKREYGDIPVASSPLSLSLSLAGFISELFLSRSPRSHNQILHPTRASDASFHFCVNIFPARRVTKLNLTTFSWFVIQSGANDAARNSETLRSCMRRISSTLFLSLISRQYLRDRPSCMDGFRGCWTLHVYYG